MTIDKLRTKLLQEAISSPALLSDLAGLELYVSESYSSRSFNDSFYFQVSIVTQTLSLN